jgi:hypothetical protein
MLMTVLILAGGILTFAVLTEPTQTKDAKIEMGMTKEEVVAIMRGEPTGAYSGGPGIDCCFSSIGQDNISVWFKDGRVTRHDLRRGRTNVEKACDWIDGV